MAVAVTFLAADDSFPPEELEGVLVRVYNEAGDTFVTEATTDEDGELVLLLDDLTTYWVRFFLPGYAFDPRLLIEVDSGAPTNTFDVEGRNLTEHPPSTDPNLCRVSGEILGADGAPAAGVTLYFMLTGHPRVVGGRIMLPSKIYSTSDADGYFEVELARNGIYDAWAAGLDDDVCRVRVPDYPSTDIADLLAPFIASVTFGDNTVTVAVEDTVDVQVTLTLSSRATVPYEQDDGTFRTLGEFVDIENSDDSVATFTVDGETGLMTILGVAAGTTAISVTVRSDAPVLVRQPDPPAPVLETIVVTVA